MKVFMDAFVLLALVVVTSVYNSCAYFSQSSCTYFFNTATSDDGIADATIRMILGVLAFGMSAIPLVLGVLTVV